MSAGGEKTITETNYCSFPGCDEASSQRCSRCKKVYYCSVDHQKNHWKTHKVYCGKITTTAKIDAITAVSSSSTPSNDEATAPLDQERKTDSALNAFEATTDGATTEGGIEKRSSRCMFCGEELVLSSEDEAVDHMRVCVALQEQLASKDQFTIPTMLREKNNL